MITSRPGQQILEFENILVFRIGHFGDTIVALPAMWAIRDRFPGARLSLLTNIDIRNPHYISPRNVLPEKGLFDDWLAYPTNLGAVGSALGFLRLSMRLRRDKYDAVIYLMPRIRTAAQIDRDTRFFKLSGISNVIGTGYLREHNLASAIPKPTPVVETETEFLMQMLSAEGFKLDGDERKTDLLITKAERSSANRLFAEISTPGLEQRLIAIAPGSKWRSKIWDEERFGDVVAKLIANENCYPVIFGGPEDKEKGDRLIAKWAAGANAAGVFSIRESAALLERCSLYLGNDTGTMHLAAAMGTPCVAIFAATDWKGRWLPFGDKNQIFRRSVECEGCLTPDCFNNHKCLDLVAARDVYDACRQILKPT